MPSTPANSTVLPWRKSSYSNGEGAECLEVRDGVPATVPVRDSKNPSGPVLSIPAAAWSGFITAVTAPEGLHASPPSGARPWGM